MKIFESNFSKDDLVKRIGDISQLGGIKLYEMIDGPGRGLRIVNLKTPAGIDMDIVIDRGMDVSGFSYMSIPLAWQSASKVTSPAYFEHNKEEWLRTFFGGLLTTCGLSNTGPYCTDNGEDFGLHGRISNIGAELMHCGGRWADDDYILEVIGKVREMKVSGDKLELTRKITTYFSKPRLVLEDTVENTGFSDAAIMILYHVNIGFPLLDKSARLIEAKARVTPRDDEAKKGMEQYSTFSDPVNDYKEQVFYHEIDADPDGNGNVAIINERFENSRGIGLWLKYSLKTLPYLVQWKQVGEGEYVCGIEPSNGKVLGRETERKNKTLKYLKPGEKIHCKLEFNVLKNNDDIKTLKKLLKV